MPRRYRIIHDPRLAGWQVEGEPLTGLDGPWVPLRAFADRGAALDYILAVTDRQTIQEAGR